MGREPFLIALMGLSMLNGMFSPLRDQALILMLAFAPAFFIASPGLILYLTMLFVSALTIMVAGVAAALFERATGRAETDQVSLAIWAAATAVLSLPALAVFFRLA
jgi:hypothetical protein